VTLGLLELTTYQERIRRAIYGMMSPSKDVPRLLNLWRSGQLRLEEMLTRTYSLDDTNQGYSDVHAGVNMPRRARVDRPTAASAAASAADPVALTQ
jgi:Zn-dependent alcohol dehydrogenase